MMTKEEERHRGFDIATLQNPDGINGFLPVKDIKPDLQFMPRQGLAPVPNGVDVDEFIKTCGYMRQIMTPQPPPYDSIQIHGYEGRVRGRLPQLLGVHHIRLGPRILTTSVTGVPALRDWAELYSVGESDKET